VSFYGLLAADVDRSRRHEAFVFIHGFNVAFDDAIYRTAQIAYDLGFDGPREHGVRVVLKRREVPLLVRIPGLVRPGQIADMRQDHLHVVFTRRYFVFEHFVDTDDELGDGPEPGELRIFEQRFQERVAGLAAVDALVGGALPVQQGLMEAQQRQTQVLKYSGVHGELLWAF
jgi:hypothetical protein